MRPGGFQLLDPVAGRGSRPLSPARAGPGGHPIDAVRAVSAAAGNAATVRMLTRCGVLARTPADPYAGKTIAQLKTLAKTDPEAVWELRGRYQNMTTEQLRKAARNDALARQVAAARRALTVTARPGDPRWEGHQLPHEATAISRDAQGNEVWRGAETSGNMTPGERALPFPAGMNASHTEVRLVNAGELPRGGTFRITGQYDPCTSCQTAMRAAADRSGCTIEYWWPGAPNGQPFVATPDATPPVGTPPPAAPPPAAPAAEAPGEAGVPDESGGGGGVGGVLFTVVPMIVGIVHNATRPGRIADKAKDKGYVPQGSRDWIERIGDAVLDPAGDSERSVPTSARLNMAKWRQIAREHFAGHQTGDLVVYRWDTPRPGKDDLAEWYIYVLGDDGRWYATFILDTSEGAHTMVDRLVPQARAALAAQHTNTSSPHGDPPDINEVISPDVPDSQLEREMTVPALPDVI